MARKKKTKEELKEERRRAMEAKRQETGWEPPEPDLEPFAPDAEPPRVVEDARALFPDFGSQATAEEEMTGYLLAITGSDWMADEPEFEAIYFPPVEFADSYVAAADARDLDPDSFAALDVEERADTHLELLLGSVEETLSLSLQDEIIDALETLRERLLEEGEREKGAEVGLVLDFMEQPQNSHMWPDVGVVSGLAQRSLNAGFALVSAAQETGELDGAENDLELPPELQAVMEQYPGLAEYMVRQSDRSWQYGVENLFAGELVLGIFDQDELEPQLEAWERTLEYDDAGEEEEVSARILEINRYVAELLTPARMDQVRTRLDELLEGGSLVPDEGRFVTMVMGALADEEALDQVRGALISAFFGELALLQEEVEAGDEPEDEEAWEDGE